MSITENTTLRYYPKGDSLKRVCALWYFTTLLIGWNIAGYLHLGFEQAWIHPLVALVTAISVQLLFEWIDSRVTHRPVRFLRSPAAFVNSLPPAIIPGLACAMLLYPNERIWPLVFAVTLSITSKVLFRAPVGDGRTQHIFNPSNLGIATTLILFPSVGFAPPYHFTANLVGNWQWIVPAVILLSGIVIHALYTGRLPLCLAWVLGFTCQGLLRCWYFNTSWMPPLIPMTSATFIIFTLYMVPDPATTPIKPARQVAFGLAVAAVYGMLQVFHFVFGLFFALAIVSALRGVGFYCLAALKKQSTASGSPLADSPKSAVSDRNGEEDHLQPEPKSVHERVAGVERGR